MALTMLSFKVPAELIEHYDILAAELSVPRSELMRKALERGRDANPVDDLARERHRKRKALGLERLDLARAVLGAGRRQRVGGDGPKRPHAPLAGPE